MIHEFRRYTANPGKGPALLERFRNSTFSVFQKHGIRITHFWTSLDNPDEMYYIAEWNDLEAKEKAWNAFRKDKEWLLVRNESEKNGPLVKHIESTVMKPLKS